MLHGQGEMLGPYLLMLFCFLYCEWGHCKVSVPRNASCVEW